MTDCQRCGVGSRGALVREFDGDTLCVDCAAPGECKRCGQETNEMTLAGDWLCSTCQDARSNQQESREASQHALGDYA